MIQECKGCSHRRWTIKLYIFQLVMMSVHIRVEVNHAGETLQGRVNFLHEKADQMRIRKVRSRPLDAEMCFYG